jgi:cell division protein FtsB
MFISPALIRLAGRLGVVCVGLVILSLVGVQYARIIGRNVALAHELHAAQHDVAALKQTRVQQDQRIRRLSDPRGAIPEIHDRLHLVRDKEAIIYLKQPSGTPAPAPDGTPP